MLCSCGKICVPIIHRLQQDLGVLLCELIVLFHVWQYTVLPKAKQVEASV